LTALALVAIGVLVLANGFFVAAEFALVSVRPERLRPRTSRAAQLVRRQTARLDEYLAACQLGITIASLALGAIGEPTFAHLLEPVLESAALAHAAAITASVLALLIMTALHITVGEQAPKSFAIGSAERVAVLVAWPLELFHRTLRPLVGLLNWLSNGLVRLFGGTPATSHGGATIEELRHLIGEVTTSGQVDRMDALMLQGVFTLDERRAAEIMTPLSQVTVATDEMTVEEALRAAVGSGHSRLPLVSAEDGRLLGVVFARELSQWVLDGRGGRPVTDLRHDMLVTPHAQRLDLLLRRMREARASITAVLDEYGQLEGVVSVEDVVEEIVGEIEDESDRPRAFRVLRNGDVICAGETPLVDLRGQGIDLGNAESESVGGLVQELLGRIPGPGDEVVTERHRLRVLGMDGRRVTGVRISPIAPGRPPAAASSPAAPGNHAASSGE
jgi:CBS domain containing-hemolysin-like protein